MEIIFLILVFILYFLPTVFATIRSHSSSGGIFALNLFLGWTLIGWVVALAWSLKSDPDKSTKIIAQALKKNNNDKKASEISNSTAEEISKLSQLKDKGILTEEEFQSAKSRALND